MKNKTTLRFSAGYMSLSVLLMISALVTAMPAGFSTHLNFLGYESFCSYAPFSTAILLVTGIFFLNKAVTLTTISVRK